MVAPGLMLGADPGLILGIDPGLKRIGVVLYDPEAHRVVFTDKAMPLPALYDYISMLAHRGMPVRVALERVQSCSQSGQDLLDTAYVCGQIARQCEIDGLPVTLIYRRQVLDSLRVPGGCVRDTGVRRRLIEMHPGGKGRKKTPGPLYGVASDGWAALAVAVALDRGIES